jgi:agmatine deiminase
MIKKNKLTYFLLAVLLTIGCGDKEKLGFASGRPKDAGKFVFPPEWKPHQAVWIDFSDQREWHFKDQEARIEIIKAIHEFVPVKVLVNHDDAHRVLDSMMVLANIDTSRITVFKNPKFSGASVRDSGPIFLSNGDSLMIADFRWNSYAGSYDEMELRGEVDNDIAHILGLDVKSSEFAAEGGGLEVSSTVILANEHFGRSRNPGKTLADIGKAYLDMYGKQKIIWIEKPVLLEKPQLKIANYWGLGGNQHIDPFMRFVNDSTILVTVIDESEKDNSPLQQHDYEALQANLRQIKSELNTNGQPFHVVEIPMPDIALYLDTSEVFESERGLYENLEPGDPLYIVPIMGYGNFFITNGVVLVSEYWHEGLPDKERLKDEKMKTILSRYFPNRNIIGLKKVIDINWGGGGVHCQTQQEPKVKQR